MTCRICLEEDGPFIHPCACKGSSTIHEKCLVRWIEESDKTNCEICKEDYTMRESCSCNLTKTCRQCFVCSVGSTLNTLYRKIFTLIFCMTSMSLIITNQRYNMITICSSTLLIGYYTFYISVKYFGHIMDIYNAALFWKFAFTLPFSISTAILYSMLFDQCQISCISMEEACDASCPVYKDYRQKSYYLVNVLLFDLTILISLLVLRNIMVCFFHMRSLKFQEFDPEKESLLSSSDSASGISISSSSSGSSGSSSSTGSTGSSGIV
jgi:uncharacterized membrane protein YgcG